MGALSPSPSLFLPNLLRPNLLRPKYSLIVAGPETSVYLHIFQVISVKVRLRSCINKVSIQVWHSIV